MTQRCYSLAAASLTGRRFVVFGVLVVVASCKNPAAPAPPQATIEIITSSANADTGLWTVSDPAGYWLQSRMVVLNTNTDSTWCVVIPTSLVAVSLSHRGYDDTRTGGTS